MPRKSNNQELVLKKKTAVVPPAFLPDTAGAMMNHAYLALEETMTVRQALKTLRTKYASSMDQRASYVYTVDGQGILTGVLQLRHLVTQAAHQMLLEIKVPGVVFVGTEADKYTVAQTFRDHHYLALPVVNATRQLQGVISSMDVMDLIQEISTEEMMKMQRVSMDETRSMPIIKMAGRRLSWLSINVLLNVLSASVIIFFTPTLQAVIALVVFLPILSDMCGVSGMQAVAVSVRDLALGRTHSREVMAVVWKELRIGFINGLLLGLEIGLIAFLWKGMLYLGLVVAMTLWLNTILAVCVGSSLPLLLKRFRLDPAIASGPILTTVTDMMGFLILLSLATCFINHLK